MTIKLVPPPATQDLYTVTLDGAVGNQTEKKTPANKAPAPADVATIKAWMLMHGYSSANFEQVANDNGYVLEIEATALEVDGTLNGIVSIYPPSSGGAVECTAMVITALEAIRIDCF